MLPFKLNEPTPKKRALKKPVQHEKIICKEFFAALLKLKENKHYTKDFLIAHIPNEMVINNKNAILRARDFGRLRGLELMGILKGIADYILIIEGGQVVFIEFKTPKGRLSDAQKEFRDNCKRLGFNYHVPITAQDGLAILDCYLK